MVYHYMCTPMYIGLATVFYFYRGHCRSCWCAVSGHVYVKLFYEQI